MSKDFSTYTISNFEKGYCNVFPLKRIIPHFGHVIRFSAVFDESFEYQEQNPNHQNRWHKLIGFKESTLEDNSGRLGVRWMNGRVEFAPYIHYKGENLGAKDPPIIYSCPLKHPVHGYIIAQGDKYLFDVNRCTGEGPRGADGWARFLCWPFVQGRFINPKPVKIKLKIL